MFAGAKDLVEGHIRYCEAEEEGVEQGPDDAGLHKSYLELVRYLPLVASLRNQIEPLEALLANVSDCLSVIFCFPLTSLQIQLIKGADMARGDDASTLKVVVVSWVYEAFGPSVPSLIGGSKDGRGLYNEHTGSLLCPSEFNWAEDE